MGMTEEYLSKIRVRVTKSVPDDRTSLYGEEVQTDNKGRQYFEIPASQVEYTKGLFPSYIIGKEFMQEEKKSMGRPSLKKKEEGE